MLFFLRVVFFVDVNRRYFEVRSCSLHCYWQCVMQAAGQPSVYVRHMIVSVLVYKILGTRGQSLAPGFFCDSFNLPKQILVNM